MTWPFVSMMVRRSPAGCADRQWLSRRARGRGIGRIRWADREPRRAGRIRTRVHPARRVPRAGRARGRHRRPRRRQPVVLMTLHSAKGLEFPSSLPRRYGGRRVPHNRALTEPVGAGRGTAPRLRRHHPRPAALVPGPCLEPAVVREHQLQPAVAVHRRDPCRADRSDRCGQRPIQLWPAELSGARRLVQPAAISTRRP